MTTVDLTQSKSIWSLQIKLLRILWLLFGFAFYLPKQFSPIRILLLRLFGTKIGKACLVCANVKVWMPWNLEIGDYVAIGKGVEVYNFGKVSVSLVSQRSYLCTASHDYTHPHYPLIWKDIEIGSQCWVAAEAFIEPGVKIGDGSVIGARSVVTQNIPAWQVNIWQKIVEDNAGLVVDDTVAGCMDLISRWQQMDDNSKAEMRSNAHRCFINRFEITKAAMSLLNVFAH